MPRLTSSQLATLKSSLAANSNNVVVGGTNFAISWFSSNPGDQSDEAALAVAAWHNVVASPDYKHWNPAASRKAIAAATDLSKFTPSDTPPSGTDLAYQNRAFLAQLKQTNILHLISEQTSATHDARDAGVRKNFKDGLTQIPTGASGVNTNAGWGTAANPGTANLAMQKLALRGEKIFSVQATGDGNDGVSAAGDPKNPYSPDNDANGSAIITLGAQDIKDAWNS